MIKLLIIIAVILLLIKIYKDSMEEYKNWKEEDRYDSFGKNPK